MVALAVVTVVSFGLSITQTSSDPLSAYFSPFTRAWELALGGLVAVSTPWLKQIPLRIATVLTWSGLVAILCSAFLFNSQTAYPGSLVAIPVIGAALVIAGGTVIARAGAESLLRLSSFQWLGKRSYSLYLWHWPILIIAAERAGKSSLSTGDNLFWVIVAVALSAGSYRLVENPIRHWKLGSRPSVMAGLALVVSTVLILSLAISNQAGASAVVPVVPATNVQVVLKQVALAPHITVVPRSVKRRDFGTTYDQGISYEGPNCQARLGQSKGTICVLGDPTGSRLMVLFGDSHALMWIPAFEEIASLDHWRLVVLGKPNCPAASVTKRGEPSWHEGETSDPVCNQWRQWAIKWTNDHNPSLLVFSQADYYSSPRPPGTPSTPFTSAQWEHGLEDLFHSFTVPQMRMFLLGSTPILSNFAGSGSPLCLSRHPDNVQACSIPVQAAVPRLARTDQATALANHVGYINTVPWFCSSICTAIVGDYELYDTSGVHISGPWVRYLRNVLAHALGLPTPGSGH